MSGEQDDLFGNLELDDIERDFLNETKSDEQDDHVASGELTPELDAMRRAAERDTIYFARNILDLTTSKIEWEEIVDGQKKKFGEKRDGPEYGINDLGPHKQMAELLNSGPGALHLEAPRDSYKSTLCLAWLAQQIVKDPNVRILYLMDTKKEAIKKYTLIRNWLTTKPMIKKLWPWLDIDHGGRVGGMFTVLGRTDSSISDPTCEASGVDSDFTGSHRDIIVMDDPVNFQNIKTKEGIEKVRSVFDAVQHLLDPGSTLVVIGTRYGDSDLYNDILTEMREEFEVLVLDCGMKLVQDAESKLWTLEGTPSFKHLNESVLLTKLRRTNHMEFSAQYLNKCLAANLQIFFREQFQPIAWDAPFMSKLRYYLLTDTATTASEDGCFTSLAMVGLDAADNAYLVDLKVGRWPPYQVVSTICDMYEHWAFEKQCKVAKVLFERVSLNAVFMPILESEMLRRQLRMRLEWTERRSADPNKLQRIQASSGRFERRGFFVANTVERYFHDGTRTRELWNPAGFVGENGVRLPSGELVDQYIRFPVGKYVDIPDCLGDLDAMNREGRRICAGSGSRSQIREELLKHATPSQLMLQPTKFKKTYEGSMLGGNRIAALHSRIQGRRIG